MKNIWCLAAFLGGVASLSFALPLPSRAIQASAQAAVAAMEFVRISPGEFLMGCSETEEPCFSDEKPLRRVRISREFEIGRYEVTQKQWRDVLNERRGSFSGDTRPVEMVSWDDTRAFFNRLNGLNDGYRYRLPTEAEWEYAARAGRAGPDPGADALAWHSANARAQTNEVGRRIPNAWGLYDMYGNVWEWVQDWYGDSYYATAPAVDPTGPAKGERHVLRGGSFAYGLNHSRPSIRFFNVPTLRYSDTGFRCVREKTR